MTPPPPGPAPTARAIRRATIGVFLIFMACGFGFASWASRLVAVRLEIGIAPGQMGLLLLCCSAGSVGAMPVSGRLIQRFGERRVLAAFAALALVGLVGAGLGAAATASALWVAVPLVALGAGIGVWDVAMNVAATDVERALHRTILPRFHAGYSFGTVLASGVGVGLARLGVPVAVHFALVAAVCAGALAWGVTTLLPGGASAGAPRGAPRDTPGGAPDTSGHAPGGAPDTSGHAPPGAPGQPGPGRAPSPWRESRVILLGVVVLALSLAEGAAGDWLASGIVQAFKTPEATGIIGLTVFLTCQTA
ncbi:MAG: MFS transporter, partial [Bifidobacteriaceae bacterium]|nr:MFS transporter [Bifidobacteriaceae bacterium]